MKLKFRFEKSETNYHGTQSEGEPWNQYTIYGWKARCVDLLTPIRANPEGGKTRARWYKRFILYAPSGAWWNFDVAFVDSPK